MIDTTVTSGQLARVTRDWTAIAGEQIRIEATEITAPIYAFGSELACLRLWAKMQTGRAAYSENLNTWFYVNQ